MVTNVDGCHWQILNITSNDYTIDFGSQFPPGTFHIAQCNISRPYIAT